MDKKLISWRDSLDLKTVAKREDFEPFVILLVVPIVLTFWVYYGKQVNFAQFFPEFQGLWNQDFYSTIYEYLFAFVMMFCVPGFIVKVLFKKSFADFGLCLGDTKLGLRLVAIGTPLLLLSAYIGAGDPAMQAEYPLAKSTMQDWRVFLVVEAFYLVYYLGWEFFFRGFMLFGLERKYGAALAILIQTIPSAIVHIGKPATESFAAILAGWVFGYIAFRSRSMLYPMLLHALVGISTDVFVIQYTDF